DRRHLPLLHQQADDIDRAFRHAVGEVLNGNSLRDGNLAHELFLRLVRALALETLGTAAERCDGSLAHFIGAQGGDQRQAAALLFDACARRRPRRRRRTSGARTARARRLFLFGFDRQAACRLARGIVFTEAFLGDFAGLAPGFLVLLAAIFFLALACISGLALGLVGAFAGGAAARGLLGNLALFGF